MMSLIILLIISLTTTTMMLWMMEKSRMQNNDDDVMRSRCGSIRCRPWVWSSRSVLDLEDTPRTKTVALVLDLKRSGLCFGLDLKDH